MIFFLLLAGFYNLKLFGQLFVYILSTVHNGLPNLLLQLAEEEVEHLPDCMESCTMVYVPQIGYMLAIGNKKKPLKST